MGEDIGQYGIALECESIVFACDQHPLRWKLPSFPLAGGRMQAKEPAIEAMEQTTDGVRIAIRAKVSERATLRMEILLRPDCPIARFRYALEGTDVFAGVDKDSHIEYGKLQGEVGDLEELRLAVFDRIQHAHLPTELHYEAEAALGRELPGPLVAYRQGADLVLLAYEHGAQTPNHYLAFWPTAEGMLLASSKGNYYDGQPVAQYCAPWIQIGFGRELAALRQSYRAFALDGMDAGGDSRTPYIFYNTWHHQERGKYFHGRPYLADMNEQRMLAEIEIAHQMGIEVFVIDTGWFGVIGEWMPHPQRFPRGMQPIRDALARHGMRLGLWFNPSIVGKDSAILAEHPEYMMKSHGKDWALGDVWESGACYGFCFASEYSDHLIELFAQLYRTLGVTYFKWDGIYQYGCESTQHWHGTEANATEERMDAYAYRMGLEMVRVAKAVTAQCPGAIFDFDITEDSRFVGLGFLDAGKYFSVNNGPYYRCFDIPEEVRIDPDTVNVFFYPGAARPQICRSSVRYDGWIPSILFLTHQLPQGNDNDRANAAASLALGGNGIWGDLLALSPEEIGFWREYLSHYKDVRDCVTRAYPRTAGDVGGSPEIHEKLDPVRACGMVVLFAQAGGKIVHVTQPLESQPQQIIGADSYVWRPDNRLELTVELVREGAATVFIK